MKYTSISLREKTKEQLSSLGKFEESYDDLVLRLINEARAWEELSANHEKRMNQKE